MYVRARRRMTLAVRRGERVLQRERAERRGGLRGATLALLLALAAFALAAASPAHAAGPSGSVVYIGSDGGVFSVGLAGGAPVELWKPPAQQTASEPRWSPSGKLVA